MEPLTALPDDQENSVRETRLGFFIPTCDGSLPRKGTHLFG